MLLVKGTSWGSGFCANRVWDEMPFDVYLLLLEETQKRCFKEHIRQGSRQYAQPNIKGVCGHPKGGIILELASQNVAEGSSFSSL